MTAVPFEDLRASAETASNVRKTLGAVVYIAPESAPLITTLVDATGKVTALPVGYEAFGLLTEDGISFEREIDEEEVRALGHVSAVRRDITGASRTVGFSALEYDKRIVRELADSIDLSTIKESATGEITYDVPDLPQKRHYRLLVIGRDGSLNSEILRAKFYPRVSTSSLPSEAWNSADPLAAEFQFTAYTDETAGFITREFLAGTGVDGVALGYKPAV